MVSLPMAGGLKWNDLYGPTQPKPFYEPSPALLLTTCLSRSSTWLSRPGCVHSTSPRPGKEQEEQSRCSGSCGCVDVPVAVCELCVCVSVTVCAHLSPRDASPGRLRAGFTPLFRNVTGTGIQRDSDVPGKMQ